MTAVVVGAFAGMITGMLTFVICWFAVANRSDRGFNTGPLPIMPPPAPPIPGDVLTHPRHRRQESAR